MHGMLGGARWHGPRIVLRQYNIVQGKELTVSKAEIFAGNCGYTTVVTAAQVGKVVRLEMESDCAAIRRMADELTEVQPFNEISFKRNMPLTHEMGVKHCTHASCPVPVGIIKAVEIEARLALPVDATIKLSK